MVVACNWMSGCGVGYVHIRFPIACGKFDSDFAGSAMIPNV